MGRTITSIRCSEGIIMNKFCRYISDNYNKIKNNLDQSKVYDILLIILVVFIIVYSLFAVRSLYNESNPIILEPPKTIIIIDSTSTNLSFINELSANKELLKELLELHKSESQKETIVVGDFVKIKSFNIRGVVVKKVPMKDDYEILYRDNVCELHSIILGGDQLEKLSPLELHPLMD